MFAHVRKDTRISPLFRTASDGKLPGPGNEANVWICVFSTYTITHIAAEIAKKEGNYVFCCSVHTLKGS